MLMSLLYTCRAVQNEATDVMFKYCSFEIMCGAPLEIAWSIPPRHIHIPGLWGSNFIAVLEDIRSRERIRKAAASIVCHPSDKPEDFAAVWAWTESKLLEYYPIFEHIDIRYYNQYVPGRMLISMARRLQKEQRRWHDRCPVLRVTKP